MQNIKHTVVEKITDTLEKNYMPYAMSVIVSRAIPEIDGFKPAHRKLLYMMYKMGLLNGKRTKSASVAGETMKLNPHGEATIYETLVRLTRGNAALLHPLIDSKGNFGKQYSRDMKYAAARYTEVKLDKICSELFGSIDKNTVEFEPNYDDTMQEPKLLPATFPTILTNANQGIAVGMASNICSFNLEEVCRATIAYIEDPSTPISQNIKGPDFPGGAELIVDRKEMQNVFETGRGTFKLRSCYRYDKKNRIIEVYEIPYSTTVETILDNLADLAKAGKLKEVVDVRDETDLNGLKLSIELKRNVDPDALMQRLYMQTQLQANFSCNFNVLIDGHPRVLGVKQLIGAWLTYRRNCVRRETVFDLENKEARLHLLQGLEAILLDIDKAIKIIRQSETEEDVIPNLCQGFNIDAIQANYIADIKLRNLNKDYLLKRIADRQNLTKDIQELQNRLADSKLLDAVIVNDLENVIKKYAQPRKTKLIASSEVEELTADDLIEDYRLKLFLTRHSYLKKLPLTSLRSAGELKTKEDDEICQEIEVGNKDEIMLFSNQGNVYKTFAYEFKDCKPSELGEYLPVLLELEAEEQIVYIFAPGAYQGFFLFGYRNGKVSKVPVLAYQTKTKRKKLVGAYSDKAPMINMLYIGPEENPKLMMLSNLNKALVFSADKIPAKTTRSNQGVQAMAAKRNSHSVYFGLAKDYGLEESSYYTVRNLPAIGYYLREEDQTDRQLAIE